jgi:predicted dehydrogenase
MIGTVAVVLLVVTLLSHPESTQHASAASAFDPVPSELPPTPPPSDPRVGWGIVGAGRISHEFAVALKVLGANITAVAAGSLPHAQSRAEAFAATFGVPNAYGSYEQLAKDPAVQVVYIGTTNQLHYDNTMLMLSHEKHVICEKPLAMDEKEAKEMIEYARKKKRLLLTNYWTRWFPAVKFAQEVRVRSMWCIWQQRGERLMSSA